MGAHRATNGGVGVLGDRPGGEEPGVWASENVCVGEDQRRGRGRERMRPREGKGVYEWERIGGRPVGGVRGHVDEGGGHHLRRGRAPACIAVQDSKARTGDEIPLGGGVGWLTGCVCGCVCARLAIGL